MFDRVKENTVQLKTSLTGLAVGIIIMSAVFFLTLYFSSDVTISTVQQRIEAANYCDTDADCQPVRGKCPFGCFFLVNKSQEAAILATMRDYQSQCAQICNAVADFSCTAGRCEWVH